MNNNYLEHHGILGQKWGVRRYQNEDGTYTNEGLKRKNSYTSGATKRAIKKLSKYEKLDKKAKTRYEQKTGQKYKEDSEDKEIRKVKETRVSSNQELDKQYQKIEENRSVGAKVATNILAGPFANKAYQTLRASGDSQQKAMAKMAVANVLGFGTGVGNLVIAGVARSSYVNSEVDKVYKENN